MSKEREVQSYIAAYTDSLMGMPPTVESVFDAIFRRADAAERAGAEWLDLDGRRKAYTYSQLLTKSLNAARWLRERLGDTRETLGIHLKNSPEWACWLWGALAAGYTPLLLDAGLSLSALDGLMAQAGAVHVLSDDPRGGAGAFAPERLALEGAADFVPDFANELIFCTAGTGGTTKLCVYTGEGLCRQINAARYMGAQTTEIIYPYSHGRCCSLALLPLHHIFGFVASYLWYAFFGKSVAYVHDLSPEGIFYTCRALRVTHIYAVPRFWLRVADEARRLVRERGGALAQPFLDWADGDGFFDIHGAKAAYKLALGVRRRMFGGVRFMISGGACADTKGLVFLNRLGYPLACGYGSSELGVCAVELSPRVSDRISGTVGRALYGFDFCLSGGELTVETEGGCSYIICNGVRTARPRVFDTEDAARRLEDGRYIIIGRVSDVIITADGENLSLDSFEIPFKDVAGVRLCCAVRKEGVTLVVRLTNGACVQDTARELFALNAGLSFSRRISRFVIAKKPVPMNLKYGVERAALSEALAKNPDDFAVLKADDIEGLEYLLYPKMPAIRELFAEILRIDKGLVKPTARFVEDLGGDSFLYASLVYEIETRLCVKIPKESYFALSTVAECARTLESLEGEKDEA